MALSNKLRIALLLCCAGSLPVTQATAQHTISFGPMINHTSVGFGGMYCINSPNTKWTYEIGLRAMVNIYKYNDNKQNYSYFLNGYADNFWQLWGLNARINRKLVQYKWLRLDLMSNVLLTCHALKCKTYTYNVTSDRKEHDINYYKASPAVEWTIGFKLSARISPAVGIFGTVGAGGIYLNHSHTGKELISGRKLITQGDMFFKDRGVLEMAGTDRIPVLSAGIIYTFK
jgi:hypothetical protein